MLEHITIEELEELSPDLLAKKLFELIDTQCLNEDDVNKLLLVGLSLDCRYWGNDYTTTNQDALHYTFTKYILCHGSSTYYPYILNVFKALINTGFNLNSVDRGGKTILHICDCASAATVRRAVCSQLFELLITAGADVNVKDISGKTPLYPAIAAGWDRYIERLLKAGADVNVRDIYGWTPLHYAVRYRKSKIIRIIVDAGGDINALNYIGETPWDMADADVRMHNSYLEPDYVGVIIAITLICLFIFSATYFLLHN